MHNMTQPKIFIRGSKLWVRFNLDGSKVRKSLNLDDTKANRKLAMTQLIPQMILKVHSGEFFNNHTVKTIPTIDEYIVTSFKLHRGHRCDSTQYAHEKNYKKYLKDIFGHLKLNEISGAQITFWQNDLQSKHLLAKRTILKIRSILYTLYEDAIENDVIEINPVKKAQKLRKSENTKVKVTQLRPFSLSEIQSILNAVKGQSRNLIATLFYTGMRAGELIGLKWEYVDFDKNTITIRRQVVGGIEKEVLKTTRSLRTIPLIGVLIPYLKAQYKITGKQNSFVFLTERTNKHFHGAGKIREQIWVKALEKANVPYRNLHQTRGTFISTLISNGEDINYVSKIAGHENVKVTLERYSEHIPMQNLNFGNCFN